MRLLLALWLLTTPVEAAEIVIRLPDEHLRHVLALACANVWVLGVHCDGTTPEQQVQEIADHAVQILSRDHVQGLADLKATVEVQYGDQALETP